MTCVCLCAHAIHTHTDYSVTFHGSLPNLRMVHPVRYIILVDNFYNLHNNLDFLWHNICPKEFVRAVILTIPDARGENFEATGKP